LKNKFKYLLDDFYEKIVSFGKDDLRDHIDMKLAYVYLNRMLGVQIRQFSYGNDIWTIYRSSNNEATQRVIWLKIDILQITERVRKMGLMNLFSGLISFFAYRKLKESNELLIADRHLQYSTIALNEMYHVCPTCTVSNLFSAVCMIELSRNCFDKSKAEHLLVNSVHRLTYVSRVEPSNEAFMWLSTALKLLAKIKKDKGMAKAAAKYNSKAKKALKAAKAQKPSFLCKAALSIGKGDWSGMQQWKVFGDDDFILLS